MKTTAAARELNQYLETRLSHPSIFTNVQDLVNEVSAVEKALGDKHPELRENPFVTAVHVIPEGQVPVEAELDRFRLFNTCLAYLSMAPIDEISSKSLSVFSTLAEGIENDVDKFRVVNLLANTLIRAENLEGTDGSDLKAACADAAKTLRPLGFFPPEYEQSVSKRVSRDHGRDFVQLLGFSADNIPSLRNLPASRKPVSTTPEFA